MANVDHRQLLSFLAAIAPLGLASGCSTSPLGPFDGSASCRSDATFMADLRPEDGTDYLALRSANIGSEDPRRSCQREGPMQQQRLAARRSSSRSPRCQRTVCAAPSVEDFRAGTRIGLDNGRRPSYVLLRSVHDTACGLADSAP